jgi:hypothetical protein
MSQNNVFHDLFTYEIKRLPSRGSALSAVETNYINCIYEGKHYDFIILFHNHMEIKGRPDGDDCHGNGFYMICCNNGPVGVPKDQVVVNLTVTKALKDTN